MQKKLNDEFIKEYSEEFSEKITSEFFEGKDKITGKEILNVSPSKQVNFFILKILFRKWQEEMKRLESPFFNYKHPDVRKAMVQFMNTLSQHIEVDGDHFISMTEEAVADTLLLAVYPGHYLSMEFEELDVPTINEKLTKPILKYLKLHKPEIDEFFEQNLGNSLDDFLDNAEDFFADIDTGPVIAEELNRLSTILPIDDSDLFMKEDDEMPGIEDDEVFDNDDEMDQEALEEKMSAEIEESDAAEEVITNEEIEEPDSESDVEGESEEESEELEEPDSDDFMSDGSEVDDEDEGMDEEVVSEESEAEEEVSSEDTVDQEAEEQVDAQVEEEESEVDEESAKEEVEGVPETINDRFIKDDGGTVADQLQQKKVESIMDAISVNHRYMFTKELFDGSREEFTSAIEKIETSETFDDAVELIVQNYAKQREWDMNSDEVKELLKVVFRRFR